MPVSSLYPKTLNFVLACFNNNIMTPMYYYYEEQTKFLGEQTNSLVNNMGQCDLFHKTPRYMFTTAHVWNLDSD